MCQKNQKIYVWIKVLGVNKIVATSADRKWDVFFYMTILHVNYFFATIINPPK